MGKLFGVDGCTDVKQVGSLGAFLAQIAKNGMRIVPGFVIPVACKAGDGLSNEILRAFDQLGTDEVILRASVVDDYDDGEVRRNVKRPQLLDEIVDFQYHLQKNGKTAAIIVQKCLNAETMGSIYSINPATRDSGEILIEADLWSGKTVLSGESDSDMILIDKRSGAISMENKEEDDICLSLSQIELLHGMIRKIDRLCAFPAYAEWAFDRGKLYVLRLGPMSWDLYAEFNQ